MSHRIAVALALALGTFASAQADTLSFTGFQTGSVAISVATPASTTSNAGEFKGLADGRSFMSYCIELTQQIPAWNTASGDYTRRGIDSDGRFDAASIGRLDRLFTHFLSDSRTSAVNSAAFQIAVWEIAYDGDTVLNLQAGDFRLGTNTGAPAASAVSRAGFYLTGLDQRAASGISFDVLHSASHQDQLVSKVPAPGTLALALGGGLAAWAGSWRAARRAA